MNKLYNYICNILDEMAPYKKLTKREVKLKFKPWIDNNILSKIKDRDKFLRKYCKLKDINSARALNIYSQYKILRNDVTNSKRASKSKYY